MEIKKEWRIQIWSSKSGVDLIKEQINMESIIILTPNNCEANWNKKEVRERKKGGRCVRRGRVVIGWKTVMGLEENNNNNL